VGLSGEDVYYLLVRWHTPRRERQDWFVKTSYTRWVEEEHADEEGSGLWDVPQELAAVGVCV
jgi:hypothetical protein